MEEELNQLTLMGRIEIKGEKYPMYLERIGLFFSIIITILITLTVWNYLDLPTWINIFFSTCLAPLFALSFAEMIGRIIQSLQ